MLPVNNLTEGQTKLISDLSAWIDQKECRFFILEGAAGTGKTYCVGKFLKEHSHLKVALTAPTNKAVKVLRESIGSGFREDMLAFCTTFSLLGLQMTEKGDIKTLTIPKEDEAYLDIAYFNLIIVDEASMLSRELLNHFFKTLGGFPNIKVIFMGDRFQLPPVGEIFSMVWELDNSKTVQRGESLTEVKRHKGDIQEFCQEVRKAITDEIGRNRLWNHEISTEKGKGTSLTLALPSWKPSTYESYFAGGSRFIAWTNARVLSFIKEVRTTLFGEGAAPFIREEPVTLLAPLVERKDRESKILATTDSLGIIIDVERRQEFREYSIEHDELRISLDCGKTVTARMPTRSGEHQLQQILTPLAAQAKETPKLWGKFWELKESFASVRHAYALTAHRSQGSTFNKVVVDVDDILKNRNLDEAWRCFYVAVTRAKHSLTLISNKWKGIV